MRDKMINLINGILKEHFDFVPLDKTIKITDELIEKGVVLSKEDKGILNVPCLPVKKFSGKQYAVLNWWKSSFKDENGIIVDGSIRSGKSFTEGVSFFMWAMSVFKNADFAVCGKTINSLRRNIINPIIPLLEGVGFEVVEKTEYIDISFQNNQNRFFLFENDKWYSVNELNLSGAFFDDVTLLHRSFVEQVVARCSKEGAKFWFNCVPESPYHWFYNEWIKKAEQKNMFYLHFTMDDNPSLTKEQKKWYEDLYTGAFYERFIEGKWVTPDNLVYPMFDIHKHVKTADSFDEYYLSCDYGTINPFSLGLWGHSGNAWYRIDEYYHSARDEGVQLTDEEYYSNLKKLAGDRNITALIVDPSAASFIEVVRKHGEYNIIMANGDVLSGINRVGWALENGEIFFSPKCVDSITEFAFYRWSNDSNKQSPVKANDHAMDDIRYFVQTLLGGVQDMEKINKLSCENLTPEDVYCFTFVVANNDIDGDFEKFSVDALNQMIPLLIGKKGINDSAQIYDAFVEQQNDKTTVGGDPLCLLKAKAYILNNEKNKKLIEELSTGIKKDTFISCSVRNSVCSICGCDRRNSPCEHRRGKKYYDGSLCYDILSNVTDVYDFDF